MLQRSHRLRRVTALTVALLALSTACGDSGGESADDAVATLGDGGVASAGASENESGDADDLEAPEDPEDAMALFDECMGNAGFRMDIESDGDSEVDVDSIDPDDLPDPGDPQQGSGSFEESDADAFDEAADTCEAHLANIDSGFDLSPEQEAAFEDAQLEWSECMRDQGVEVPDFDGSGSGSIVVEGLIEGEGDPQSQSPEDFIDDLDDEFEAAAEKCQSVFENYDELDELFEENEAVR